MEPTKLPEPELKPEHQAAAEVLPTYNDVAAESTVPLLSDEKEQQQQQEPQQSSPPKYQRQEGVEERELTNNYSTGLFDCFGDFSSAGLAWFCPCATSGVVNSTLAAADAQYDDESLTFQTPSLFNKILHSIPYSILLVCGPVGCVEAAGLLQRYGIRAQYGMEHHLATDCLSHTFCHPCAMAQDHREVKIREEHRQAEFSRMQQELATDL